MRYHLLAVIFLLFLFSCQKKKELPNAQELLRRELHTIDWTKVDTYPTFDSCDTVQDKLLQEKCFFDEFKQQLEHHMMQDSLIRYLEKLDTISVRVAVKSDESIQISAVHFNKKQISKQMLDSILELCSKKITPVHAATKRGIPVTTEFDLHLELHASSDYKSKAK